MKTIEIKCPVLGHKVLVHEFNGDVFCPACEQKLDANFEHKGDN